MNAEFVGCVQNYGNDTAAQIYGKLEEVLTAIQTIKAKEGSEAHNDLLAASNSVCNAQLMIQKFMKAGDA